MDLQNSESAKDSFLSKILLLAKIDHHLKVSFS